MATSTVTPLVASEDDASQRGRTPIVVLGFTALIAAAVLATQEDPRSGSGAARISWSVRSRFGAALTLAALGGLGRHRRHRVHRARPRNAARLPRNPRRRAADALRRQPAGRLCQRCRVASASRERGRAAPPHRRGRLRRTLRGLLRLRGGYDRVVVLAGWLILGLLLADLCASRSHPRVAS
jgi:hypothetical protein